MLAKKRAALVPLLIFLITLSFLLIFPWSPGFAANGDEVAENIAEMDSEDQHSDENENAGFQVDDKHTGQATYFKTSGKGACLLGKSTDNLLLAAVNKGDFDNAALCGAYLNVKGPNGEVNVKVVDLCPGCEPGHMDLSREAFAEIAALSMGRIDITWELASPELDGPIAYYFKNGSPDNVALVQLRNHRNPVSKLEYQGSDSEWIEIPRTANNYFEQVKGIGAGPFNFRVTDIHGNELVDSNIRYVKNNTSDGKAQFPAWSQDKE